MKRRRGNEEEGCFGSACGLVCAACEWKKAYLALKSAFMPSMSLTIILMPASCIFFCFVASSCAFFLIFSNSSMAAFFSVSCCFASWSTAVCSRSTCFLSSSLSLNLLTLLAQSLRIWSISDSYASETAARSSW